MKKSDIILIGALVLIIIISVVVIKSSDKKETKTSKDLLSEITYKDYEDMINSNEKFVVVIERTGCSYCEKYMPIVKKVAKDNNIDIYYIDTSTLSEEDFNKLGTSNEYLSSNEWGTPTTLLLEGTKVLDSIGGYVEKKELISFLEDNNIIK